MLEDDFNTEPLDDLEEGKVMAKVLEQKYTAVESPAVGRAEPPAVGEVNVFADYYGIWGADAAAGGDKKAGGVNDELRDRSARDGINHLGASSSRGDSVYGGAAKPPPRMESSLPHPLPSAPSLTAPHTAGPASSAWAGAPIPLRETGSTSCPSTAPATAGDAAPQKASKQGLASELAILSGLSHPHVIRVHGSCSVKGGSSRFIVMELCKCTLNGLMRLRGPEKPMPLEEVLRVSERLIADDPWMTLG